MRKFTVHQKRKLIIKKSHLVLVLSVLICITTLYFQNRFYSTEAWEGGLRTAGTGNAQTSGVMGKLSSDDTFYSSLETLYNNYGAEIAAFRPKMRSWCKKTNSCKFTDYEAEMLFMLIRENKPQKVFEMAPNLGYSTHWILHALHLNDNTSVLHSFDIHSNSVKHMDPNFESRWVFTLGDYAKLFDDGKLDMESYDFLFIDSLHEEMFAREYCKRLFSTRKQKAIVAIHDIVADEWGGGRESAEVYKYLALANNVANVFTMSQYAMPNSLYERKSNEIIPKLNKVRAGLGIVKDCDELMSCDKANHDFLHFESSNPDPSIFFTLNY